MRKRQHGFTIIELVVVILLLGILTATALPRFIDISDDAHNANVNGTAASFIAGVTLIKSKALASQAVAGTTAIAGTRVNTSNLPSGGTTGTSDVLVDIVADCTTIWDAVMDTDVSPSRGIADGSAVPAADFGIVLIGDVCHYSYVADGFVTATPATSARRFSYSATATPPVSITTP